MSQRDDDALSAYSCAHLVVDGCRFTVYPWLHANLPLKACPTFCKRGRHDTTAACGT
jgi:hypothetical protein